MAIASFLSRAFMGPSVWHVLSVRHNVAYAERQNLNIRMQNRRFTRLTNAFSTKAEMLAYSLAITFCYHNFVRVHQTLKTTPAVATCLTDHVWTIRQLLEKTDLPNRTH